MASKLGPWLRESHLGRHYVYPGLISLSRFIRRSDLMEDLIDGMQLVSFEYNHPQSRGWVRLRSADPFDKPLVNPRYLTDPSDVEAILQGVKKIRDILKTPSMSRFVGEVQHMPGVHKSVLGVDFRGNKEFFEATDDQL